ncbi:MAG TPA: TolC family protein, partial [Candidatus Polarisedimenticolia bacterium]|nr:TolC family protein [Candidatus Polarisedimenticolia bacterium]
MRPRPALRSIFALMLFASSQAFGPAAPAQESGKAPLADPPYPDGAIIESIPPNAIVLSLDETIKAALDHNLTIAVQRYQPRTTATFVDVERSVFDPLVTGNVFYRSDEQASVSSIIGPLSSTDKVTSYTASWLDPLTTGGSYSVDLNATDTDSTVSNVLGSSESTGYNTSWALTYRQPLLRNLGRDANLWPTVVAQKTLGISESVFRQTVIDTVAQAESAYWDLNFAIMQLRTERFSLKLAQDFLEQNRIKVRVGTLAPIEITQAEAGVADREETVIIFEAALRAAEDQIRRVIGVASDSKDWDRPVRPSDPLTWDEVTVDEDEAMAQAIANRPDIEQARLAVEARATEDKARDNLRRWGLDFQGIYGNLGFAPDGYGDSYDDLKDRNQTSWSTALTLSVPIHNRFAIANKQRTENELAQANMQLQQTEQAVRVAISAAVRQVRTNIRRVQSAQVNVRLQREKLQAEQKKFENGMSTSFQVLQFQDDLANAETRENLAKNDYAKALVELARAKGTTLTERGILFAPVTGDQSGQNGATTQSRALRPLWEPAKNDPTGLGLRLADTAS